MKETHKKLAAILLTLIVVGIFIFCPWLIGKMLYSEWEEFDLTLWAYGFITLIGACTLYAIYKSLKKAIDDNI